MGEFERFRLMKARVLLLFLIMFEYCFVHFNFVSMTTPRYLAESVSDMGVSWIKCVGLIGSFLFVILISWHLPG